MTYLSASLDRWKMERVGEMHQHSPAPPPPRPLLCPRQVSGPWEHSKIHYTITRSPRLSQSHVCITLAFHWLLVAWQEGWQNMGWVGGWFYTKRQASVQVSHWDKGHGHGTLQYGQMGGNIVYPFVYHADCEHVEDVESKYWLALVDYYRGKHVLRNQVIKSTMSVKCKVHLPKYCT